MGANATTFVPAYVAGEVLTAANLSVTNSGIPVFATTVTRDAAFGGTGEKTLAEGQFAYIEATNTTQYYDGAAWQSVGQTPGLVLIAAQTIGSAVASVTVSSAFSATYDSYLIKVTGGTGSVNDASIGLQLGATTTGYYNAFPGASYSPDATGSYNANSTNNGSSFNAIGRVFTDGLQLNTELNNPFLAKYTFINGNLVANTVGRLYTGVLQNTTSYTAFTLTPNTGTLTGGTIRVYGYANS
jgi:hypothetical protein